MASFIVMDIHHEFVCTAIILKELNRFDRFVFGQIIHSDIYHIETVHVASQHNLNLVAIILREDDHNKHFDIFYSTMQLYSLHIHD